MHNLRRVFSIVLVLWVLGAILGAVCWRDGEAQQIVLDTSTAQYKANAKYIDSLIAGPFLHWVKVLRLPFWRIVIRADSLPYNDNPHHQVAQSFVTAATYVNEPYRNALIIVSVERLHDTDPNEVFLHELWHIVFAPYTQFVGAYFDGTSAGPLSGELRLKEERLVTERTRAMLWGRER